MKGWKDSDFSSRADDLWRGRYRHREHDRDAIEGALREAYEVGYQRALFQASTLLQEGRLSAAQVLLKLTSLRYERLKEFFQRVPSRKLTPEERADWGFGNAVLSNPDVTREMATAAAAKRSNGGVNCDVEDGPCACGAWHQKEEVK